MGYGSLINLSFLLRISSQEIADAPADTRFYLRFQTEIVATEMKKAEPFDPASIFVDSANLP